MASQSKSKLPTNASSPRDLSKLNQERALEPLRTCDDQSKLCGLFFDTCERLTDYITAEEIYAHIPAPGLDSLPPALPISDTRAREELYRAAQTWNLLPVVLAAEFQHGGRRFWTAVRQISERASWAEARAGIRRHSADRRNKTRSGDGARWKPSDAQRFLKQLADSPSPPTHDETNITVRHREASPPAKAAPAREKASEKTEKQTLPHNYAGDRQKKDEKQVLVTATTTVSKKRPLDQQTKNASADNKDGSGADDAAPAAKRNRPAGWDGHQSRASREVPSELGTLADRTGHGPRNHEQVEVGRLEHEQSDEEMVNGNPYKELGEDQEADSSNVLPDSRVQRKKKHDTSVDTAEEQQSEEEQAKKEGVEQLNSGRPAYKVRADVEQSSELLKVAETITSSAACPSMAASDTRTPAAEMSRVKPSAVDTPANNTPSVKAPISTPMSTVTSTFALKSSFRPMLTDTPTPSLNAKTSIVSMSGSSAGLTPSEFAESANRRPLALNELTSASLTPSSKPTPVQPSPAVNQPFTTTIPVPRRVYTDTERTRLISCLSAGSRLDDIAVNDTIAYIVGSQAPSAYLTISSLLTCHRNSFIPSGVQQALVDHPDAKLLLPLHLNTDFHWVLAVVDRRNATATVYDSLATPSTEASAKSLLLAFMKRIHPSPPGQQQKWNITHAQCPQQPNVNDCGIFVIMFAAASICGWDGMRHGPINKTEVALWRCVCTAVLLGEEGGAKAVLEGKSPLRWSHEGGDDDLEGEVVLPPPVQGLACKSVADLARLVSDAEKWTSQLRGLLQERVRAAGVARDKMRAEAMEIRRAVEGMMLSTDALLREMRIAGRELARRKHTLGENLGLTDQESDPEFHGVLVGKLGLVERRLGETKKLYEFLTLARERWAFVAAWLSSEVHALHDEDTPIL